MVEHPGGARFLFEAAQRSGDRCERLRDQLDRDVAAEARVFRAIDLAHAAFTEPSDDLVGADPGADIASRSFWPAQS